MGLRAKFNLALLAAFAVGFGVAAIVLYKVFVADARGQVLQSARIMMTAATAVRKYTADELDPVLPATKDGKFVPETIPFFAAQKTFADVQAAFPGFGYREYALNPTNPNDRAPDWAADIIRGFRVDADKTEAVIERDSPNGPTLNLARPISIRDQACLSCHDTPAAAPAGMIASYGTANGFGWKFGETVGTQIVSVPMTVPLRIAFDAYKTFLGILIGIFAVIFLVINLLLHFVVIQPVRRVSAMADAVSIGEDNVEAYIKPGRDEISSLSVSFNRMRESISRAMAMLNR
jgi:HAMP domain-containing protein